MVRVIYRATTMKSCVDIVNALRCRGVVGQHQSKASKEDHLLVLAVKNEGGVSCYEKGIVPKEQWNPKMLNPNGT
jgi:hypothetical protein